MKKHIFLMMCIALCDANVCTAFDFTNYVPTLGTNSAYTLSFTPVTNNNANNTITTYSVNYDNYSIVPQYYLYSVSYGSPTNNHTTVNSDLNNGINESFIGNLYNHGTPTEGSAIYNNGATIDSITGDFVANTNWSSGGAIYNYGGTITTITGDFINNRALNSNGASGNYNKGGAINNQAGLIDSITGIFIGNTATSYGGAIYNNSGAIINSITADFIANKTGGGGAPGAAIYNRGSTINSITGDFIANESSHCAGAIYNYGNIGTISGDFIGNTATQWGGAIYNESGSIQSITGDFIGNMALRYGGAVCNDANIEFISGNFIGNYTTELGHGGAVYTSENIKFLSETDSYIISGNYSGTKDTAIIMNGTGLDLTFENKLHTSYTINDEINAYYPDSYNLYITGDGTGYTTFKNNIDNVNNVNIINGRMIFNRTPDNYTGTADIGHFTGTPTMNLQNGTFDIANGYVENITLNNLVSTGNNNVIRIDLDINSNAADFITVTGDMSGQINLVVSALANLDIGDDIIWFANIDSDDANLFNLYSVSGLDYELGLYFDADNHQYGLATKENANVHTPEQPATLPTEVVQMANYAAITVTHTVQKLTNSMQKRVGELQWAQNDTDGQTAANNAFWTRNIYKNYDMDDTSAELSSMEFGYDRIISSAESYKWYIGGLGYISWGDNKFKNTMIDIDGYGLGAYIMLIEKSGWFGDLVFRQHFINMDTSNVKTDYTASSLNAEFGKEFVFGDDTSGLAWFIKPALEATYISISGTRVDSFKIKDSASQTLSLSVLGGPRWDFESGRKFQLYGKIGYTLDNSDDVNVVVDGVKTSQEIATNTIETGAGFNYRGTDNATNIYMEASYITGTDYSEISGNLGIRYVF